MTETPPRQHEPIERVSMMPGGAGRIVEFTLYACGFQILAHKIDKPAEWVAWCLAEPGEEISKC